MSLLIAEDHASNGLLHKKMHSGQVEALKAVESKHPTLGTTWNLLVVDLMMAMSTACEPLETLSQGRAMQPSGSCETCKALAGARGGRRGG